MITASTLPTSAGAIPGQGPRFYSVFGGVLRSDIEFPELRSAPECSNPDWSVMVADAEPPDDELVFVGERLVKQERYQLWRSARRMRLAYSHAGTFDIASDGCAIIWYRQSQSVPELVRNIVLGPAMAIAFERAGFLCLHGSAVAIGGAAVAFLGPKYFGKSTLATALTTAGCRLIGDDLLVVCPGSPPMVRPGVASVRLWADTAAVLPLNSACEVLIPGIKTTATGFGEGAVADGSTRLAAIYLLSPVTDLHDGPSASRIRLSPMEASVALALQTKLPDSLVGLRAAGSQLSAAAGVASTVPIWTLHVVRDLSLLDGLVRQIIDWSTAP